MPLLTMSHSADSDYKAIFSHPEMVIDIITGFAPGPWLEDVDFSTLEPYKSSFIAEAEEEQERHADLVWRLRCKENWLYIYLLFEFQSSIHQHMAIRMLVYVGLLYQELIKNRDFTEEQKLPFILPIVLYNGTPRWNAPLTTQDLIHQPPQGLEQYLPNLQYFLIDEGSYATEHLENLENLAAALFLIETQTTLPGLYHALDKVLKLPNAEKRMALRAAIARLAARVLRKNLPQSLAALERIDDLKGVVSMLTENIDNMLRERESKGLAVGLEQGLERGIEQGIEQGLERGIEQGLEQGIEQGVKQGGAMLLKALLTARFGPLSAQITDKIDQASAEELTDWSIRQINATSLQSLFAEH